MYLLLHIKMLRLFVIKINFLFLTAYLSQERKNKKKTKSRMRGDTIEPNVNQILPNKRSFDKYLRPWTLSTRKIENHGKRAGD